MAGSILRFLMPGVISMQAYFSQSPACKWASIQRLLAQLHGSLPPAGSLSAALIACDGFITLGL
jgi:hypothetical protein